jgi:hypothetical protein
LFIPQVAVIDGRRTNLHRATTLCPAQVFMLPGMKGIWRDTDEACAQVSASPDLKTTNYSNRAGFGYNSKAAIGIVRIGQAGLQALRM